MSRTGRGVPDKAIVARLVPKASVEVESQINERHATVAARPTVVTSLDTPPSGTGDIVGRPCSYCLVVAVQHDRKRDPHKPGWSTRGVGCLGMVRSSSRDTNSLVRPTRSPI